MSTDSKLQQINTFLKGMNTDTSDMFIPNDLYRYAENLRFVTNTGENSGGLRLIEGYETLGVSFGKIIAVAKVRDWIVVLSNATFEGSDKATIQLYNPDTGEYALRLKASTLWSTDRYYSLVTRWEDDDNVKLYVADGKSPLRVFDITPSKNEIATSIEGTSTIASAANIFSPIQTTRIQGYLKPAIVLYAYIMYNKYYGSSNVSPSSEPVSLYNDDGGVLTGNTTVGVRIKINLSNAVYNRIKLYRITYYEIGQSPTIDLIDDRDIVSNYTFDDVGQTPITSDTSFAEFLAYDNVAIQPQYIEEKNDYLFAAGVKYYKQEDLQTAYNLFDASAQPDDEDYLDFTKEYKSAWNLCNGTNIQWRLVTKTTEITSHDKSLRRNELYRYGIILYDKNGYKWPVKWIVDLRTPPQSESNPFSFSNGDLNAITLGVKFKVNNLDAEKFPNYEIVRCKREITDRFTISLGIVGKTMYCPDKHDNKYYPAGFLTLGTVEARPIKSLEEGSGSGDDNLETVTTEDSPLLFFASPEVCYNDSYVQNFLNLYENNTAVKLVYSALTNYIDAWAEDNLLYYSYNLYGGIPFRIHESNNNIDSISLKGYAFEGDDGKDLEFENANSYDETLAPFHLRVDLANRILFNDSTDAQVQISNHNSVSLPDPNKFANDAGTFTYKSNSTVVDTLEYIGWSAALVQLDEDTFKGWFDDNSIKKMIAVQDWWNIFTMPVGTTGKGILIQYDGNGFKSEGYNATDLHVADIRRNNTIPYGGYTEDARLRSIYTSRGNYFDNDAGWYDVYDGDCFLQEFYYNALHLWYHPKCRRASRMSVVYVVPLESDIDMRADSGASYYRNQDKYIQDEPYSVLNYVQDKPAYQYNTAYSAEPTIQVSTGVDEDDLANNTFDYRVVYSKQKLNNESTDSWLLFKSADYIDVDTKYGPITGLKLFKNNLFFWQKNAAGILSVNERTVLQDENDANIILGNGEILQRYDYLTTQYGMQPMKMCTALSDTTLYWWDLYNQDIIAYPGGQAVAPMKKAKTVSNLINKDYTKNCSSVAYDNKYNELLVDVTNDGPLVYSEFLQQFTSVYTIKFDHNVEVNGLLYLFDNDELHKWNQTGINLTPRLKYIINSSYPYVKVYDNVQFGMGDSFYTLFYNEPDENQEQHEFSTDELPIAFSFNTPLGLNATVDKNITNREYDFRFIIPRNGNADWGGRLRGKTMQCELTTKNPCGNFSIQYIITKYRISWS